MLAVTPRSCLRDVLELTGDADVAVRHAARRAIKREIDALVAAHHAEAGGQLAEGAVGAGGLVEAGGEGLPTDDVLDGASHKADANRGRLRDMWEEIQLLIAMVRPLPTSLTLIRGMPLSCPS